MIKLNYPKLTSWVLYIPWLSVLLLLFLQLQLPNQLEHYGFVPLLIGIIFLGLPHGALDHLVPSRMGIKWAQHPLGVSFFLAIYVAIAVSFFALWFWQPSVAFTLFLAASIWHWGQGDLRFLELFLNRSPSALWGSLSSILLRGSLPIALPLLAFPETAQSLFNHMGISLGFNASFIISANHITVGLVFLLVLSCLYMLNALLVSNNPLTLATDGLELVLLVVLFSTIPAYISVGVYFLLWHSLRHLLRLLLLRPNDRVLIKKGRWLRCSLRLAKDLTPITLVALCFLFALYFFARDRVATTESFIALYLSTGQI